MRSPDTAPHRAERPQRSPKTPSPAVELTDAIVERARAVLAEIVRLTGSSGGVDAVRESDCVRLVITGDPSGLLIGRRGQTLDALEYVLHRIVAHEDEASGRLIVDAGDYRLRRRQSLEQLTHQVAERARRIGKPLSLSPMSPRDRRIVHLALQDDPTLTTRSAGTGFYRKVVIVPAGARRSPKRKE
jgi:spoIIIJ-associated protein